jgi:hypothetical protein
MGHNFNLNLYTCTFRPDQTVPIPATYFPCIAYSDELLHTLGQNSLERWDILALAIDSDISIGASAVRIRDCQQNSNLDRAKGVVQTSTTRMYDTKLKTAYKIHNAGQLHRCRTAY